jgi:antitoxin VapB
MLAVPPETEELARRVAEQSGRTPEEVLRKAVETEALLAGVAVGGGVSRKGDPDRAREFIRRVASKPLLDQRSAKEILDEAWGIPDDRGR